jgi:hypothetical protein
MLWRGGACWSMLRMGIDAATLSRMGSFGTGRRRYLDFHRENLRLEARPSMQHLEQRENDELRFAGGG